jgi:hypothetical protein
MRACAPSQEQVERVSGEDVPAGTHAGEAFGDLYGCPRRPAVEVGLENAVLGHTAQIQRRQR